MSEQDELEAYADQQREIAHWESIRTCSVCKSDFYSDSEGSEKSENKWNADFCGDCFATISVT